MSRVILEDSRQKPVQNAHIRLQLEKLGYKVDRSKMYIGDYQFADNGKIVIDTKQDLQEVCGNVTQQHERFQAECVRAKDASIKLVILVQEQNITCLSEVCGWFNWRRKKNPKALNGIQLWKIMKTMSERYGVEWLFCKKTEVGKTIIDILEGR